MDNGRPAGRRILDDAITAAETLGLRFKVLKGQPAGKHVGVDATMALDFGGRQVRYLAEVRGGLRPATLGPLVHQLKAYPGPALLVADHVTPPLADALRDQGVQFIDTAGNAFLNQPPLLVFVKGQRPKAPVRALEPGRAFQPTGLQVLFVLLARPELTDHPYREIARAAGVAHGTVGGVMAELLALGFLAEVGGRRRLLNGVRLLMQWTEAYARTLRPRLLLGRFRGDVGALGKATGWPAGLLIGGELAAAKLTRHLRPATATFHAEAIDPKAVRKLRLTADANGNVEFRRRFWNLPGEGGGLTPELLVYADLLAIGDARGLETAELLRGPLIDRLG